MIERLFFGSKKAPSPEVPAAPKVTRYRVEVRLSNGQSQHFTVIDDKLAAERLVADIGLAIEEDKPCVSVGNHSVIATEFIMCAFLYELRDPA